MERHIGEMLSILLASIIGFTFANSMEGFERLWLNILVIAIDVGYIYVRFFRR